MIKDHGIFSMMIILLIFITLSLDSEWILLGENCCWSLLGLKGLRIILLELENRENIENQPKMKSF